MTPAPGLSTSTGAGARLLALPDLTTLVADVLDEVPGAGAVLSPGLLPRTDRTRLCGPAAVLLLGPAAPGESISHGPMLASASPGSVGVVDAGGHADGAVLGGRLARQGVAADRNGVVVVLAGAADEVCRRAEALSAAEGFPAERRPGPGDRP